MPGNPKSTDSRIVCRSTTRKSLTIATPGTQRSKTDRRFHRPAPSGQKQTAVFTTFGSAIKNRPPFSPLLAQRSKTDHRFHHFWPSGQKQTTVFTTFGPAVKNRPPFSPLLAQRSKTDRRFHNFWPSDQKQTTVFTAFGSAAKTSLIFGGKVGQKRQNVLYFFDGRAPATKKWPDTQEEKPIAYPANFPAPGWRLGRQPFNPIAYPANFPAPGWGLDLLLLLFLCQDKKRSRHQGKKEGTPQIIHPPHRPPHQGLRKRSPARQGA